MTSDFHLYRRDRLEHWRDIAACIRGQPAVLDGPLANIERWLATGRLHPAPLLEWRRLITGAKTGTDALQRLLEYLEADNHDSEPLKSCSPFVGCGFEALDHPP